MEKRNDVTDRTPAVSKPPKPLEKLAHKRPKSIHDTDALAELHKK